MNEAVADPIVVGIVEAVTARLDGLVAAMAERIVTEIEYYRNADVQPRDLHTSLHGNTRFTLAHLAAGDVPLDLSAPTATGRLRAGQGVPLPEVLRAYRLGFTTLWEHLLAEADRSGPSAQGALLRAATSIWEASDTYSQALTAAYRDAVAERLLETDRRRSALVAALVDGPPPGDDTAWEIAQLLDFPYQGTFLVVNAEAAGGAAPLPGLEARCRALEVGSAWRAQPGNELGVLSCPGRRAVELVLETVRACATGRVGVSPAFERLDQTPRALRYAQVALESLPAGSVTVRQLDDTPLTEMVMTNLETTRRAVNRILGGLLSLPEDDRTTLLATARAWLEANGSAAEAARQLFCHQNTVRYRMHRIEEHLRGPLDNPKIVAELAMALDAVGTFPTLLEARRAPEAEAIAGLRS
ncbi:PucR family transcriptional regulator [Kitasatospora sp. NPDC006697]|uniref:PucR family transcriptional regulator n=1 Tax=Kitasatospora sp. NPDC006697 TaxID=3364020 RepID=UPI00368A2818